MRPRVAVPVVSAILLVVVAATGVTAVRSEAREGDRAAPESSAVSLARVDADGSVVTVPALGETGPATATVSTVPIVTEPTATEPTVTVPTVDRAAASRSSAIRSSVAEAAQAVASRLSSSRAAASSRARASRVASSSAAASRSAAAAGAAAAAAAASARAAPTPDTSAAVEEATEEAAENGITQSVVVMNRQTGAVITSVDADADVPAMSLFKLIIAADVIDQAGGSGNVDPDTLGRLQQMIIASDDSIAQDFYDDDGQGDITTRVADRYGLSGTTPSPDPEYWGDVQITAHDMASLLYQLLSGSGTAAWFTQAMQGSLDTAADGFDQNFGVNAVPGAGSKQGWGCCLSGVMAIHSVGFTANQIIVVLSTAANDVPYTELDTAQQLTEDPGAQAGVAAVTTTVQAALPPS